MWITRNRPSFGALEWSQQYVPGTTAVDGSFQTIEGSADHGSQILRQTIAPTMSNDEPRRRTAVTSFGSVTTIVLVFAFVSIVVLAILLGALFVAIGVVAVVVPAALIAGISKARRDRARAGSNRRTDRPSDPRRPG
jgi:hypothetical protein